jgi:hypothetical protein
MAFASALRVTLTVAVQKLLVSLTEKLSKQ